jgi:diaminopimelate epimerase
MELSALSWDQRDELRDMARALRYDAAFPKGANANLFTRLRENEVRILTFERGVEDFTYACGTGTGSLVTVLTLQGKVSGKNVKVNMTGGQLIIDVERDADAITNLYLTGPTNIVAKGVVCDENLTLE